MDETAEQRVLLRASLVIFLQNEREQGALRGSGVIVPVRHAEEYHPDGYNVGWNCGAVGGQTAMHAHMHVIPRFRQEPYAGRGIRYWLKQPENRWW